MAFKTLKKLATQGLDKLLGKLPDGRVVDFSEGTLPARPGIRVALQPLGTLPPLLGRGGLDGRLAHLTAGLYRIEWELDGTKGQTIISEERRAALLMRLRDQVDVGGKVENLEISLEAEK